MDYKEKLNCLTQINITRSVQECSRISFCMTLAHTICQRQPRRHFSIGVMLNNPEAVFSVRLSLSGNHCAFPPSQRKGRACERAASPITTTLKLQGLCRPKWIFIIYTVMFNSSASLPKDHPKPCPTVKTNKVKGLSRITLTTFE